jgi:serine/threonine protein kinase
MQNLDSNSKVLHRDIKLENIFLMKQEGNEE